MADADSSDETWARQGFTMLRDEVVCTTCGETVKVKTPVQPGGPTEYPTTAPCSCGGRVSVTLR